MAKLACDEHVKLALEDPKIKKLILNIPTEIPILSCKSCSDSGIEGNSRAIILGDPFEIVLCANRLSKGDVLEVLTHELIHAVDFSNKHYDFKTCEGLAATEIRAAREAECRDELTLLGIKESCIRRKAVQSTRNMFPSGAKRCVKDVFDVAMKDMRPFDQTESN